LIGREPSADPGRCPGLALRALAQVSCRVDQVQLLAGDSDMYYFIALR